jgi:hypothetical protein
VKYVRVTVVTTANESESSMFYPPSNGDVRAIVVLCHHRLDHEEIARVVRRSRMANGP